MERYGEYLFNFRKDNRLPYGENSALRIFYYLASFLISVSVVFCLNTSDTDREMQILFYISFFDKLI